MFDEYQLLDDDIGAKPPFSEFGFDDFFYDADSYGYTQAFLLCMTLNLPAVIPNWYTWTAASIPPAPDIFEYDVCKDLDIDSDGYDGLCYFVALLPLPEPPYAKVPNCYAPTVIEALLNAALKPQSFINRPGFEQMGKWLYPTFGTTYSNFNSSRGGLLMPRLEPDVLLELAKLGMNVNHLAHGKSNISS